jgi:FkbM family methyltransferase
MKLHSYIAKAAGYELIKQKKHPTVESHIMNLIRHYRIDLMLDVGANQGQFGTMLREEGYAGEMHSFEPVHATFEKLAHASAGDPNWHIHQYALGESCGEEEVNITKSTDLSSFLKPNDFGKEKFEKIEVTQTEVVKISTVFDFLNSEISNAGNRRIFLKMDTQGYDLNVFAGAVRNLKQIHCILSELSFMPIYEGMPHYIDALQTYESHDFHVTGLYPISRNKDLTIIEMDCLLANRKSE